RTLYHLLEYGRCHRAVVGETVVRIDAHRAHEGRGKVVLLQAINGIDALHAHDVQVHVSAQHLHSQVAHCGDVADRVDSVAAYLERHVRQTARKLGAGRSDGYEYRVPRPYKL